MKKNIPFIICLIVSIRLFPAVTGQYTEIYRSLKSYPPEVLSRLGERYFQSGSLDSALVCFSIVSGTCKQADDQAGKLQCAHAFNRCGVIYIHYNSYTKAMNMFLKSLEICEGTPYSARVYNNVGNLYCFYRDYKMADNYCRKAYLLSYKSDDKKLKETVLYNLIGINYYLQDYEKVNDYVEALGKLNPQDEVLYRYHWNLSNGVLNYMKKKYVQALSDFKSSLACADSSDATGRNKYVSISHISKCFAAMNLPDSALYYIKKGEKILRLEKYSSLKAECYADISTIYHLAGNEKQALSYKKAYLELADSLFNVREFGQMKDLQFLHEMEKIEKQVSQLTDERVMKDNKIESQQLTLSIVVGALLVILALLAIMYIQVRRLREANLELFHKNLEIMESEEERKKQRRKTAATEPATGPSEEVLADTSDNPEDSKIKYQNSILSPEEKARIREAILDVMDNTLEYCSVSFTLDKLAVLINARSKSISQIINESFSKNFNTFVNEYRIKEVQRRLLDSATYGKYTLVFIAASVGFRSDSNFNAVFKRITGMTPTAYRNMVDKCRRPN